MKKLFFFLALSDEKHERHTRGASINHEVTYRPIID